MPPYRNPMIVIYHVFPTEVDRLRGLYWFLQIVTEVLDSKVW